MVVRYNIEYNNKLIKCAEFESLMDQYRYIDDFIASNKYNTPNFVNTQDNFMGMHSLAETLDGMKYGFKENTEYFLNVMAEMKSTTNNFDGIYMDYQGFGYDIGSVINGEPECCLNMGEPKSIPCIKIIVDIAFSYEVKSKLIYNRGIAITNLIHTLINNGCIVDLYMLRYNIQKDMDILYTTYIDTKYLSIDSIAFVCSPEYFRKIGWITTDKLRGKPSEAGRGYSTATEFLLNKINKDKIFFVGGDYTLPSITQYIQSPESANKFLLQSFKDFCTKNKIYISFDNDI